MRRRLAALAHAVRLIAGLWRARNVHVPQPPTTPEDPWRESNTSS